MRYSSKLLLFGEHTINRGSQALAIPYPAFGGEWAFDNDFSKQQRLPALADYLENLQQQNQLLFSLDYQNFRSELAQGLFFESNIPIGYGLGSSGALCAAIYDRFGKDKISQTANQRFQQLRQTLAQIESFFHGTSSGTDPLICYLNQPVLITSSAEIAIVDLPTSTDLTFFLLDTEMPRSTGPLVQFFLQRCEDQAFLNRVTEQLVVPTNAAIAAFLQARWKDLFENVNKISRFQIEELSNMTPEKFHDIWKAGLSGDLYRLKMCGAGGGGFILGISQDWQQTQALLKDFRLQKI